MAACPDCCPKCVVCAWHSRLFLRICRNLHSLLVDCWVIDQCIGENVPINGWLRSALMRIGFDTTALAVSKSGVGVYTDGSAAGQSDNRCFRECQSRYCTHFGRTSG